MAMSTIFLICTDRVNSLPNSSRMRDGYSCSAPSPSNAHCSFACDPSCHHGQRYASAAGGHDVARSISGQ